jgi:hypothetical protein
MTWQAIYQERFSGDIGAVRPKLVKTTGLAVIPSGENVQFLFVPLLDRPVFGVGHGQVITELFGPKREPIVLSSTVAPRPRTYVYAGGILSANQLLNKELLYNVTVGHGWLIFFNVSFDFEEGVRGFRPQVTRAAYQKSTKTGITTEELL